MGKDFDNPFGLVAPKSGRTRRMSELIDSMVIPGIQGGPLMHVIAGKAVAFLEALRPGFETYGRQVIRNAQSLAARLTGLGYDVVSGGTDNHLMLLDLRNRNLTGKDAQEALDEAGITVNRWAHGYAYEYNSLWDPILPEHLQPCVIGRQRFGQVSLELEIAQSPVHGTPTQSDA